jgi:LCP family protein required for cell wall assembly
MFRGTIWIWIFLILLLGGIAFVVGGGLEEERMSIAAEKNETTDVDKPFSVVALGQVGVGHGGRWHFAPELTDTIMLIYLHPATSIVNIISLPRDLYGSFGAEKMKINRAALEGKTLEVLNVLSQMTGIEVGRYVIFDLGLVKSVIDDLGGIDIILPVAVHDPVGSFSLDAGANHLDGETAAWLIRNRYAPQGDFFREKNQHVVLEAIFTRFNQLTSLEKTSFVFRTLPDLSKSISNFSLGETISDLEGVKIAGFNSVVLDFDTKLWQSSSVPSANGEAAYVLIPEAGVDDYTAIRAYVQEHLK